MSALTVLALTVAGAATAATVATGMDVIAPSGEVVAAKDVFSRAIGSIERSDAGPVNATTGDGVANALPIAVAKPVGAFEAMVDAGGPPVIAAKKLAAAIVIRYFVLPRRSS